MTLTRHGDYGHDCDESCDVWKSSEWFDDTKDFLEEIESFAQQYVRTGYENPETAAYVLTEWALDLLERQRLWVLAGAAESICERCREGYCANRSPGFRHPVDQCYAEPIRALVDKNYHGLAALNTGAWMHAIPREARRKSESSI